MKSYFMKTERIGFSVWEKNDLALATLVWGDQQVTKYICATGSFTKEDIEKRLQTEISNLVTNQIQYWPIFDLTNGELIGCCGLRPFPSEEAAYEIGFHLRKVYWGKGYATEAAKAVIQYATQPLNATKLYAGHHPKNEASKKLLVKLGFSYIGKNYYEPTGLYHPSYELRLEK